MASKIEPQAYLHLRNLESRNSLFAFVLLAPVFYFLCLTLFFCPLNPCRRSVVITSNNAPQKMYQHGDKRQKCLLRSRLKRYFLWVRLLIFFGIFNSRNRLCFTSVNVCIILRDLFSKLCSVVFFLLCNNFW